MKITDIKVNVIEIDSPMGPVTGRKAHADFVRVFTDEGVEGQFFAAAHGASGRGLADVIVDEYKPMIMGRDPFDRESIIDSIVNRHTATITMNAIGALDVALWDIAGKATGLPIYKLLGGCRDKIRAYASTAASGSDSIQSYADYSRELVEKGYTAIKLHPRGGAKEHVEACRATREAVGDGIDLMLDSMCRYDRREALWVGRELEKLNYYWYEEPLWNSDLEGNRELSELLEIPIAATEAMYTTKPADFVPYIAGHIVDIIRGDAQRGITMTKKVADICDAFDMKYEPHGWGFAASQFANLQVTGAIKNCDFFEKVVPSEMYDVCAKDTIEIDKEGFVHMPTKPGLGIEFDLDEIEKRTVLSL